MGMPILPMAWRISASGLALYPLSLAMGNIVSWFYYSAFAFPVPVLRMVQKMVVDLHAKAWRENAGHVRAVRGFFRPRAGVLIVLVGRVWR